MTIENPKRFIQGVLTSGDFGSEPKRGYYEPLLTRTDGAMIWFRKSVQDDGTVREILGLSDGKHHNNIMLLSFSHPNNTSHSTHTDISVGVVENSGWERGYVEYTYSNSYGDWRPGNSSGLADGSPTNWFLTKGQLRKRFNQEATVHAFLEQILQYVQLPDRFEAAALKPILVP